MKILITGATGFVGSHLAALLAGENHEVHALVRNAGNAQRLIELGVKLITGSLATGGLPAQLPAFSAVIHLAGLIKAKSTQEFYDINSAGTRRLIGCLDRASLKRFIIVSSIAARGPNAHATDHAGLGPVSEYGKSKLDAENIARELLPAKILTTFRPPPVYGPGDTATLGLFKMFKRGVIPSFAGGQSKISFVYVEDLAKILACAINFEARTQPYYTEDGAGGYSPDALADAVKSGFGKTPRVIGIPPWITVPAAAAVELLSKIRGSAPIFSRDKLGEIRHPFWFCHDPECHQAFGITRPVTAAEGFARTKVWYENAGWL